MTQLPGVTPGPEAPRQEDKVHACAAVLEAERRLLWIESADQVAAIARDLVERLGGTVVSAEDGWLEALPIDISFGVGRPALPHAPRPSIGRMLLEEHLPVFVRDGHRAIELAERTARLAEDAAVDPLTGLSSRRILNRVLARLRPDQTVVLIDLDKFKPVNDLLGHDEGDRVLRAWGRTLSDCTRGSDRVGRFGGEEFLVILDGDGADDFLHRLRYRWLRDRPQRVTFSAGIAPAAPNPTRALAAADRAMYRAKELGRDQWTWAREDDYQ